MCSRQHAEYKYTREPLIVEVAHPKHLATTPRAEFEPHLSVLPKVPSSMLHATACIPLPQRVSTSLICICILPFSFSTSHYSHFCGSHSIVPRFRTSTTRPPNAPMLDPHPVIYISSDEEDGPARADRFPHLLEATPATASPRTVLDLSRPDLAVQLPRLGELLDTQPVKKRRLHALDGSSDRPHSLDDSPMVIDLSDEDVERASGNAPDSVEDTIASVLQAHNAALSSLDGLLAPNDAPDNLLENPFPVFSHSPSAVPETVQAAPADNYNAWTSSGPAESPIAIEDDEDDDDLMVLDAAEAARTGKFKPSTFSTSPSYVMPGSFNQPAPVLHIEEHPPANQHRLALQTELQLAQRERSILLDKLNSMKSKRAQEVYHLELLHKEILKKQNNEKTLVMNTSDSLVKHQLGIEIREDLHAMRNIHATVARYNEEIRRLDDLMHANGRRINSIVPLLTGHHSQPIQPANNYLPYIPRPINNGFAHNVYAPREDVDLQDLLNNIRDDEETEDGMELTPAELSISLMKHQRIGLSWLLRMENSKSKGGILADDMGLGKTVQAIALIMSHKSEDSSCKTTLVVGPVSLLRQWAAEIESKVKRDTKVKIAVYHGSDKRKLSNFRAMKQFDVVMTSYGTLSSEFKKHYRSAIEEAKVSKDQNVLPDENAGGTDYVSPFFASESNFYRIILDEAQNIKNKLSIASKAVSRIKSTYRFCLSGTPMQNNVDELYPILRFLRIRPYDDQARFNKDISVPIKSKSSQYDEVDRTQSMKKLRALLRAILLRRTKDSLIDGKPILSLPDKHVLEDYVVMGSEETTYYKDLEAGIQKRAKKLLAEMKRGTSSSILTLLLRLRQACLHSFLVEIGQLNQADKDAHPSLTPANWQSMYNHVVSFSRNTVERIKSDLHQGNVDRKEDLIANNDVQDDPNDETMFTCPICFDVLGYESIVLFAGCGHMICENCVENYFERFEVGDESTQGKRVASCFSCSRNIKESELIDYNIFHKIYHEDYSYERLSTHYAVYSSNGKMTNPQKVQHLVREAGGFTASAKIEKAIDLMSDIFEKYPDEKIILFSQFTGFFDLMKLVLDKQGIEFLRYDGSMSIDSKNNTIKEFYQGNKRLLMLSLRAGNVGLTLTCASHVIIMDPFWNPFVEEQAMDRAYRIGQQREVYVHRILIEGTIERRIMDLQTKKKEIINAALDEKGMQGVSRLGRRELGFLFGLNTLEEDNQG